MPYIQFMNSMKLDGIALGGLSVGETKEEKTKVLKFLAPHLQIDKPHYVMGVGTPENILECISMGVDMFDCVMPSRNGRNGMNGHPNFEAIRHWQLLGHLRKKTRCCVCSNISVGFLISF